MSDHHDYAYDDQGNLVLIRYAQPPRQSYRHSSSISTVSSMELPLIRQRHAEEAELERQKARARAEENQKQEKERAASLKSSLPNRPQKRAMQLDIQSED